MLLPRDHAAAAADQILPAGSAAIGATCSGAVDPPGHHLPTNAGYSTAALISTAILIAALAASLLFAPPSIKTQPGAQPSDPPSHFVIMGNWLSPPAPLP